MLRAKARVRRTKAAEKLLIEGKQLFILTESTDKSGEGVEPPEIGLDSCSDSSTGW